MDQASTSLQQPSNFNPLQDVLEFSKKFQLPIPVKPTALLGEMRTFRSGFLVEEAQEYDGAGTLLDMMLTVGEPDDAEVTVLLEDQLDAMVDLVYVALGNIILQGMAGRFVEAWRRVHRANMAKVRAERPEDSKRGTAFDVIKPPGWVPPSHTDLVEDHAHRTTAL